MIIPKDTLVPLGVKEIAKNLEGTVMIYYNVETSKILGAPGVIKFKKIKKNYNMRFYTKSRIFTYELSKRRVKYLTPNILERLK